MKNYEISYCYNNGMICKLLWTGLRKLKEKIWNINISHDIQYKRLLLLNKPKTIRWFHQLRATARTNEKRRFQYYPTHKKTTVS